MPHLNDRDILADFLKDAKFKSQAYHMATVESANESIRDTCQRFMNDELQNHRALFRTMSQRGWYPVESVNQQPGHFQAGGGYGQGVPGTMNQPDPTGYGAFRREDHPQQPRATGHERFDPRFRG